jgi:hypothetical protein
MLQGHFCETHNTKYYRNEKVKPDGKIDVWYSHKKLDGNGFCTEAFQQALNGLQDDKNTAMVTLQSRKLTDYSPNQANGMYVCNAMNNAVNLASNGVIGVNEIGNYFNRILSELQKVA